jgi:hypothetical protein
VTILTVVVLLGGGAMLAFLLTDGLRPMLLATNAAPFKSNNFQSDKAFIQKPPPNVAMPIAPGAGPVAVGVPNKFDGGAPDVFGKKMEQTINPGMPLGPFTPPQIHTTLAEVDADPKKFMNMVFAVNNVFLTGPAEPSGHVHLLPIVDENKNKPRNLQFITISPKLIKRIEEMNPSHTPVALSCWIEPVATHWQVRVVKLEVLP